MTQETEHTPGPWGIIAQAPKQHDNGHDCFILGAKDWSVKDMTGPAQASNGDMAVCIVPHIKGKYCDGNLRLIIAAPELLEALEAMIGKPHYEDEHAPYIMAKKAIKKARGQS